MANLAVRLAAAELIGFEIRWLQLDGKDPAVVAALRATRLETAVGFDLFTRQGESIHQVLHRKISETTQPGGDFRKQSAERFGRELLKR